MNIQSNEYKNFKKQALKSITSSYNFRCDSDYGYMLLDTDIINALLIISGETNALLTYDECEHFFEIEYAQIKLASKVA